MVRFVLVSSTHKTKNPEVEVILSEYVTTSHTHGLNNCSSFYSACGLGSIPGLGVICGLSLMLVLIPALRVFLRVLQFSSLHKKQFQQKKNNIPKFQFNLETVELDSTEIPIIIIIIIIIINNCATVVAIAEMCICVAVVVIVV